CKESNLVLNWEKCHFMVKEGIVLGHYKGKGHAGFYRRFIKDFSKISRPLTKPLEKDAPFVFCSECIQAFNLLKEKLVNAPIMVAPDWNLPFELMCDASDYAVGVVLGQRREKKFQPIYYVSKTLNEAQQNYTTTEKVLLAIIFSFDKYRSYLVLSKTIMFTDHVALRFPFESLMYTYGNDEYPWFADIAIYLAEGTLLKGMSYQQKNKFFADINGPIGGHNTAANITRNVFEAGFHWPTIFKDAHNFVKFGDACQRAKNISTRDEMPQTIIQVEAQALPTNDARVVVKFLKQLFFRLKMDNPNITMEEYIRLQEEKALSRGETFNWQTATYGKMEYCEDEDDCFTNFETKFPAIVLDNTLTSDAAISCGPTVSPLNDNEIDFRISFDESDDEDYTVVYDENSFSYKIISVNNLKTDSENDNDKVNMPSFPSPEPEVSYFNDLDFFKDFENEFPAIVYNDALTSKLDLLTEPTISPRHIDEFDLKDETSLSECDEEEQNILYFNDLFPFNVIYPDDLKSDTDNNNKIDIERPSGDMSVTPIPDEPSEEADNVGEWVAYLYSGLQKYLNKQGFNIVGYGYSTCTGNSGEFDESVGAAIICV
ncbi:hypothetical protein Tco_0148876, partial [Tanacetum coccineum]